MKSPRIRYVAAQWTMLGYPTPSQEWTLDQKMRAAKDSGFNAFAFYIPDPSMLGLAQKHGLQLLGYIASGKASEFKEKLQINKATGAHHINVQMADEDTLTPEAVGLAILLIQEGRHLGVEPAIEVHRDTCTETPEKTYALADAYQKVTGELMPMTWDFSHLSVVKHLNSSNYKEKLLVRPDLIQRAQQFHFRPFNGHHAQVPVTDGKGNLSLEVQEWLPFAEAVMKCWIEGNRNTDREIYICPELGPVPGGYNLSTLPNSWEEAQILRVELEKIWNRLMMTSADILNPIGERVLNTGN